MCCTLIQDFLSVTLCILSSLSSQAVTSRWRTGDGQLSSWPTVFLDSKIVEWPHHLVPRNEAPLTVQNYGRSFWFWKWGQRQRARNLHSIVWPARIDKVGCKNTKNGSLSIQKGALISYRYKLVTFFFFMVWMSGKKIQQMLKCLFCLTFSFLISSKKGHTVVSTAKVYWPTVFSLLTIGQVLEHMLYSRSNHCLSPLQMNRPVPKWTGSSR